MNASRATVVRRAAVAGGALVVAVALAGCSQVAALAPVGGDRVTTVKNAANDLMLADGVAIKVAPICKTVDTTYDCKGSTMSGEPIALTAPTTGDLTMVLKIGDAIVYDGPVQPIIDQNAQVGP